MFLRCMFSCSTVQVFSLILPINTLYLDVAVTLKGRGFLHKQRSLQHLADRSLAAEPGGIVFLSVPFGMRTLGAYTVLCST